MRAAFTLFMLALSGCSATTTGPEAPTELVDQASEPACGDVIALAAGARHSCALLTTGRVFCWGDPENLGRAPNDGRPEWEPGLVANLTDAVSISVEGGRTCARRRGGQTECWGAPSMREEPVEHLTEAPLGLEGAPLIARGAAHGCACRGDGEILCWGSNSHGQAGQIVRGRRPTPRRVSSPASFTKAFVGRHNTCALDDEQQLWCWGGATGLPLEGSDSRSTPTRVDELEDVVEVAIGREHACALNSDGIVRCWGRNGEGQLGDGTTDDRAAPVRALEDAEAITAGARHTCALLASGRVSCWGANDVGQLGGGGAAPPGAPVMVSDLDDAIAISAGNDHTCAVRRSGGEVRCWGANQSGQLGDGTTENHAEPVSVPLRDVVGLWAGAEHTCALRPDGRVSCWGANRFGQLGDGTHENRSLPVTVSLLRDVQGLSAGEDHTCALLYDAEVFCWGSNARGQLGRAGAWRPEGMTNPTRAPHLTDINELSRGVSDAHTCALPLDGGLFCWGDDEEGQLGIGAVDRVASPTAVTLPESGESAAAEPDDGVRRIEAVFHVMSKCPYGVQVIQGITPVARFLGESFEIRLEYIGRVRDEQLTSMHGNDEVVGDKIQLCVRAHAPYSAWLDFLDCQNEAWRQIPARWEQCAEQQQADVEAIRDCVEGAEGEELLRESFWASQEAGATGSPTMFIDGMRYQGGRSTVSFARSVCDAFGAAPPPVCQEIPLPDPVPITLLGDERCERRECSTGVRLQSIGAEIPGAIFTELDYRSPRGRELFDSLGIKMLPVIVVGAEIQGDRDAFRKLRGFERRGDQFIDVIGRFDPVAGAWTERPEVPIRVLVDERCKSRECKSLPRFLAFLERQIPRAKVTEIDYSTRKGRALWRRVSRELKKAGSSKSGGQPPGLPLALFDKAIEAEEEAFSRLERRFHKVGSEYAFALGRWDPTAEICDNGRDDDRDRRIDCRDSDCAELMACRPEKARQLSLFVMSECPYGVLTLDAMEEVLDNFGRDRSKIDFRVEFVGQVREDGSLSSMHGASELEENLREACAQHHYSEGYAFMDYIWCRNRNIRSPDWEQCVRGQMDVEVIRRCSEGDEGYRLMRDSFELGIALEFRGSPSWLLNNRHQMNGRDPETIKEEFCERNPLPECENSLSEQPTRGGGCG